jgi:hypothetical protein
MTRIVLASLAAAIPAGCSATLAGRLVRDTTDG